MQCFESYYKAVCLKMQTPSLRALLLLQVYFLKCTMAMPKILIKKHFKQGIDGAMLTMQGKDGVKGRS